MKQKDNNNESKSLYEIFHGEKPSPPQEQTEETDQKPYFNDPSSLLMALGSTGAGKSVLINDNVTISNRQAPTNDSSWNQVVEYISSHGKQREAVLVEDALFSVVGACSTTTEVPKKKAQEVNIIKDNFNKEQMLLSSFDRLSTMERPSQLVMIGMKSHGKTSLLERLFQLTLIPEDDDIVRQCSSTTTILRMELRSGPVAVFTICIRNRKTLKESHVQTNLSLHDLGNTIGRFMQLANKIERTLVATDHEVYVKVTREDLPNIDVVDLPSLVTNSRINAVDDYHSPQETLSRLPSDLTNNIISKERDRSIFLVVVDIAIDNNYQGPRSPPSPAKIIRMHRLEQQTIVVLTNLDKQFETENTPLAHNLLHAMNWYRRLLPESCFFACVSRRPPKSLLSEVAAKSAGMTLQEYRFALMSGYEDLWFLHKNGRLARGYLPRLMIKTTSQIGLTAIYECVLHSLLTMKNTSSFSSSDATEERSKREYGVASSTTFIHQSHRKKDDLMVSPTKKEEAQPVVVSNNNAMYSMNRLLKQKFNDNWIVTERFEDDQVLHFFHWNKNNQDHPLEPQHVSELVASLPLLPIPSPASDFTVVVLPNDLKELLVLYQCDGVQTRALDSNTVMEILNIEQLMIDMPELGDLKSLPTVSTVNQSFEVWFKNDVSGEIADTVARHFKQSIIQFLTVWKNEDQEELERLIVAASRTLKTTITLEDLLNENYMSVAVTRGSVGFYLTLTGSAGAVVVFLLVIVRANNNDNMLAGNNSNNRFQDDGVIERTSNPPHEVAGDNNSNINQMPQKKQEEYVLPFDFTNQKSPTMIIKTTNTSNVHPCVYHHATSSMRLDGYKTDIIHAFNRCHKEFVAAKKHIGKFSPRNGITPGNGWSCCGHGGMWYAEYDIDDCPVEVCSSCGKSLPSIGCTRICIKCGLEQEIQMHEQGIATEVNFFPMYQPSEEKGQSILTKLQKKQQDSSSGK